MCVFCFCVVFLAGGGRGHTGLLIQAFKVDFTTNNRINILLNNLKAVDCQRNKNEKVSPNHRLSFVVLVVLLSLRIITCSILDLSK